MRCAIAFLSVVFLSGCSGRRFEPISGHPELALDTKTGQACYTLPSPQVTYTDPRGVSYNEKTLPFCSDLAAYH
jgi:hypothetical protein